MLSYLEMQLGTWTTFIQTLSLKSMLFSHDKKCDYELEQI